MPIQYIQSLFRNITNVKFRDGTLKKLDSEHPNLTSKTFFASVFGLFHSRLLLLEIPSQVIFNSRRKYKKCILLCFVGLVNALIKLYKLSDVFHFSS